MKILTDAAQIDRDEWKRKYEGDGCRCHISPPCNSCTHPGNPDNQAEDQECWQEIGYDMM